jgi:hypothetical protein
MVVVVSVVAVICELVSYQCVTSSYVCDFPRRNETMWCVPFVFLLSFSFASISIDIHSFIHSSSYPHCVELLFFLHSLISLFVQYHISHFSQQE